MFDKLLNLKKNKNTIEWIPATQEVEDFVAPPEPTKNCIPQWYKDKPGFDLTKLDRHKTTKTLKMCMPFLDAFLTGYTQKTWCDINIAHGEKTLEYHWAHPPEAIGHRDEVNLPIGNNYKQLEFVWKIPWLPKLPKNYSVLITHPLNREDLPFRTLTGIIDADDFYHVGLGQLPFYLDKDFEGIIPAGTPIFQCIPFERTEWKSKARAYNEKERNANEYLLGREFFGVYKRDFWKKKTYE